MENSTGNKTCEKCSAEPCVCVTETVTAPVVAETVAPIANTEVTLPSEPIEEKVTFKHPSLDNKASNSKYVLSFEEFKKSKVKVEKGMNKTFTDMQTSTVAAETKTGEPKKTLDNKSK